MRPQAEGGPIPFEPPDNLSHSPASAAAGPDVSSERLDVALATTGDPGAAGGGELGGLWGSWDLAGVVGAGAGAGSGVDAEDDSDPFREDWREWAGR